MFLILMIGLSKMAQLLYVGGPDIEQYAIKDTRILSCFLECISTHHELALRLVVKAKIDGIKVIELPLPVGTVNTKLSMGEPFNGPGYRAAWRDATVVSSMGSLYIIPTFGKKL